MAAAREYLRHIVATAKKHPCHRFLNDFREVRIALSVVDLYEIPDLIVTGGFDRRWRRAMLLGSAADLHKLSFFELVASNRGITVRLFTEVDKAIQWLHTESEARQNS